MHFNPCRTSSSSLKAQNTDVRSKSIYVASVVTSLSSGVGGGGLFLCSCRRLYKLHVGTLGIDVALMRKPQEARQSKHFRVPFLGIRRSSNSRQKLATLCRSESPAARGGARWRIGVAAAFRTQIREWRLPRAHDGGGGDGGGGGQVDAPPLRRARQCQGRCSRRRRRRRRSADVWRCAGDVVSGDD